MVIDHFGWLYLENDPWFRAAGRFAAPFYFYLIGHANNKPLNLRLLILGIICTFFYWFQDNQFTADILITFLFVRYFLTKFSQAILKPLPLVITTIILVVLAPITIQYVGYGTLGFMWAIMGHLKLNKNPNIYWFGAITLLCSVALLITLLQPPDNEAFELLYMGIFIIIFTIFLTFQVSKVNLPDPAMQGVYFLSRYSLQIYVLHFCGFIIISKLIRALAT